MELEKAWDKLWHHQGVGVPKEGLVALNKTNGKYLQTNRSTAAKPEYYALVGMFHQLHCLNIIRQATWPTDMYDKGWGEELQPMNVSESQGRAHVDHCVETLRLSLMCFGDVTPMLLLTRDGTLNTSTADFNVHHKCRSYEQIRDFVDASAVDPVIAGMGGGLESMEVDECLVMSRRQLDKSMQALATAMYITCVLACGAGRQEDGYTE
ncbi:hypothetical protein G3M48_005308 [Beauveria asiatica]|uniref:Uncharacterized protein n=1 Tax=Beauveria asiatica TaxID=1069075 RepID=A0AAW0S631_9HYPO